jgi:hypothetical protein
MSNASMLAAPLPPDTLEMGDVQEVVTVKNGFCLYDSITKASNSPLSNWTLACTVANRVQEFINKSNVNGDTIFVDVFLSGMQGTIRGGDVSGEIGYPLQTAVETQDQPCIMLDGVCRNYVPLEQFTESLWKLKTDNINDGPRMWPDINSIGLAIASLDPAIGWVVYTKEGDTYNKETDSIALTNLYFSSGGRTLSDELTPLLTPTHMIMLLHTGGNHYQVLQPTNSLMEKQGAAYDLLKKWPLSLQIEIPESCKVTAAPVTDTTVAQGVPSQQPKTATLQDIAAASQLVAKAGNAAYTLLGPKPYVFPTATKPTEAPTTTVQAPTPFTSRREDGDASVKTLLSEQLDQITRLSNRIAALEARPIPMAQTQTNAQTSPVTYVNASVGTDLASRSIQPAYIYPKGLPAKPTTAPTVAVGNNKDTFFDENKSVPDWAKGTFNLADVPAECRKVDFYTPNCRSAEVFKSLVTADKVAREDAMYGDSQMDAFRDLQSKIANAADPTLRAALERQRESQFPKFKTLEVFVPGSLEGVQPVKIANPYVSYMYRRDVSNTFFPAVSNRKNDPNGEMAAANIQALKAVGATPAMRANKGFAISLLESLWHCGSEAGAGGPRCYPLQTLAQLREYGAAQEQQAAQARGSKVAQSLLAHMPATRLAAIIMQGLRNAGVRATIVPVTAATAAVALEEKTIVATEKLQPGQTPLPTPSSILHARFTVKPPPLSGLPSFIPTTIGRRPDDKMKPDIAADRA